MEIFEKWKQERRKFILKMTIFSIVFFLSLPISIGLFPEFMSQPRFGWLSFAWLLGFAQIGVTWLLCWFYWLKAEQLDELLIEVKRQLEAAE